MSRLQVRAKHLSDLAAVVRAAQKDGMHIPDEAGDEFVLEEIGVPVNRDIRHLSLEADDDDFFGDVDRWHLPPGDLLRPVGAKDEDICFLEIEDVYVPAAAVEIRTLLGAVDDDEPSSWTGWQQALIRMHCGVDEPTPDLLSKLTALRNAAAEKLTGLEPQGAPCAP